MMFIFDLPKGQLKAGCQQPQWAMNEASQVALGYKDALEKLGMSVVVADGDEDLTGLMQQHQGKPCVWLRFSLPHEINSLMPGNLPVPVFGWQYSDIPDEPWNCDERNDWRNLLAKTGSAITYSSYAAAVLRKAMGADFKVAVAPAPVWDHYSRLASAAVPRSPLRQLGLQCSQVLLDSYGLDFSDEKPTVPPARHDPGAEVKNHEVLELTGLVYTAVFDPNEGCANWRDFVSGFCWAFADNSDVSLVLVLTGVDSGLACASIVDALADMDPFNCRVVAICDSLSQEQYEHLISASSYFVSSSSADAQCLPAMAFMSAGVPALAPDHTAFGDYIDAQSGFVVASSREWVAWPHDPRIVRRTFRYRINWESLLEGYQHSYRVAFENPERYARLSTGAVEAQSRFCSVAAIEATLSGFFNSGLVYGGAFSAPADGRVRSRIASRVSQRMRNRIKKLFRVKS